MVLTRGRQEAELGGVRVRVRVRARVRARVRFSQGSTLAEASPRRRGDNQRRRRRSTVESTRRAGLGFVSG